MLQSAQHMPEAMHIKTTMHGPANRISMFSKQDPEKESEDESDAEGSDSGETPTAAAADGSTEKPAALTPEALNEHETIIGIDQENIPTPMKLFDAFQATMDKLRTQATKIVQASLRAPSGDDVIGAVAKAAAQEHVRRISVDLQDIAKQMAKSKGSAKAELERLVCQQEANGNMKTSTEALAVPAGKPLSMFDAAAFPGAFTEFLFGDCVPFLPRQRALTCQQIFDALLNREELEYNLPADEELYKASELSRFDSPEFCTVFADYLRKMKLFQSCRASFERPACLASGIGSKHTWPLKMSGHRLKDGVCESA